MGWQADDTVWCGDLRKEADYMRAHADKTGKNSLADVAQPVAGPQNGHASVSAALLNDKPQVQQLKARQQLLGHSPQLAQLTSRQLAAQARPNRTGLPDQLKSGMEQLSGMSLDGVRVHYNSGKPAQLQALAYAQGSDIHLAPGQEKHLPHEAWHVVQQAQGRVRPTMQMKGEVAINDDAGLEREADVMGARAETGVGSLGAALAHGRGPMNLAGNQGVAQRVPDEELPDIVKEINKERALKHEDLLPDDAVALFLDKYPALQGREKQDKAFVLSQFRSGAIEKHAGSKAARQKRTDEKQRKVTAESAKYISLDTAGPALAMLDAMLLRVSQHMKVLPLIEKMETSLRSVVGEDCRITLKGYILELFISYITLAQGGSVQEPEGKADALVSHHGSQFAVQAKYGTPAMLPQLARGACYQLMGLSASGVYNPETAEQPPEASVRTAHLFVEAPASDFDALTDEVLNAYKGAYGKTETTAHNFVGKPTRIVFDLYDTRSLTLSQRVMDFPDGKPAPFIMRAEVHALPQASSLDTAPGKYEANAGDVVKMADMISMLPRESRIDWISGPLRATKELIAKNSGKANSSLAD